MTTTHRYEFGDRVRHCKRPEWGIGSVIRSEEVTTNGDSTQRLAIRFDNAGLKTLSTQHAELEPVVEGPSKTQGDDRPSVAALDRLDASGWLGPMAQRKIEELMISLPTAVRDPFNSYDKRLELTLDLYRFDRGGRSLVDWAVAQTGLADPLSRFTRQELEQHFDRWSAERDGHLRRLLQESPGGSSATVSEMLDKAPASARNAVQRVTSLR